MEPSHAAPLDVILPCDTEHPLLWCGSSHKILSPLPAIPGRVQTSKQQCILIQSSRVRTSLFFNRLHGYLCGCWAKSPEMVEEEWRWAGACLQLHGKPPPHPWGYLRSSLLPILCTPLLWSFMTPMPGVLCLSPSVPQPTCLLLPSDCLLPLSIFTWDW